MTTPAGSRSSGIFLPWGSVETLTRRGDLITNGCFSVLAPHKIEGREFTSDAVPDYLHQLARLAREGSLSLSRQADFYLAAAALYGRETEGQA